MQKQVLKQQRPMPLTPRFAYEAGARAQTQTTTLKTARPPALLRADTLYTQLNQLGLITASFDEEYRFDRRTATRNLLRQLIIIQKLYQGSRIDVGSGSEELQIRAMHLNTHLINTAGFGVYSNAAKINILYQLRRVLEKLLITYFGAANMK